MSSLQFSHLEKFPGYQRCSYLKDINMPWQTSSLKSDRYLIDVLAHPRLNILSQWMWASHRSLTWERGRVHKEQVLHICPKIDGNVLGFCKREEISCRVAMAIAIKSGTPNLGADHVPICFAIVWRHACFKQGVPCRRLQQPRQNGLSVTLTC